MEGYVLKSKLGEGAFSVVYRAVRKQDEQEYALKKINLGKQTEKGRNNCLNEVRILASINNPYVLQYKDSFFDQASGIFCLVTELVDGGDLSEMIAKKRSAKKYLEEECIWRMALQLLKAVEGLHARNILHRDIKTANIFINKDLSVAKLGDMNISIVSPTGMASTQTGTPYYASPEVWGSSPYDSKCDIWSLGCVLYEMANQRPPFSGKDLKELKKNILQGMYPRIPERYSEDLELFIKQCLCVNPKHRPTATQLLNDELLHRHCREVPQEQIINQVGSPMLKKIDLPPLKRFKQIEKQLPLPRFERKLQVASVNKSGIFLKIGSQDIVLTRRTVTRMKSGRRTNSVSNQQKVIIRFIGEGTVLLS